MSNSHCSESKFSALLQDQIRNEFNAAAQYIAVAVYFDSEDLPQLAAHFYRQAVEERNHAMMLVRYLLDRGLRVEIPGTDPVRNEFSSVCDALTLAVHQEHTVTEQITALAGTARDERDYLGEQFVQWFLKEQVEEVASMGTLLRTAERAGTNLCHIEEFVAREMSPADADPGAPAVAGGPL